MADIISQQGLYQDGNSIFENVHILGTLEVTGIVKSETNLTSTGSITASKFIGDGSELSGIDATTIKDSAGTTQIQGTTTGATHSGKAVFNELEIGGKLYDGDGDFGTSGQVLASDGTNTNWVNTGSLTAGAASEVGVTAVNTDSDHFITFVDSSSGNEEVRVDTGFSYNPFSGTLTATTFSGGFSGGDGVFNDLTVNGELKDGAGNFGSAGQVLSSDGTDTAWVNAGSLTAGAAAEVGVNQTNTTDSTHFPVFVEASSGNEEVRVDTGFTYNPNSGTLTATTFSGAFSLSAGTGAITNPARLGTGSVAAGRLQANSVISGNINDNAVTFDKLQDIPQSHLIGRIASGSGDATFLTTSQVKTMLGTITNATNASNVYMTDVQTDANFLIPFTDRTGTGGTSGTASVLSYDSSATPTYNPSDNRLNVSKLQVHQISPTGTYDAGSSNQVLIATGGTPGLDWGPTISSSAGNSTIVQRNGSGYIFANYYNGTGTFATSANTSGMGRFTGTNGSDTYGRSYTAAAARALLNVADGATNTPNITNNNQLTNGAGYITSAPTPKVNQVLSTTTTSTQYYRYYQGHIDTGLSLTINCADANNKIHIEYTIYGAATRGNSTTSSRPWGSRLLRNNSQIAGGTGGSAGNESAYSSTPDDFMDCHAFSYIDTPGAGNHTYKVQIRHHLSASYSNYLTLNRDRSGSYRAASTLTCSEIVY